jgi:hypothetical protein
MAASNPIDFKTLAVILPFIKDAVLLRGPHGIGKSAVPADVSKQTDKRLLDVRLSLFTEGDLIGVPDHNRIKETGVTSFAPPDWLHTACNEPCVLFLDEINRATPGVQNSAFQLVLDREVKGWRLHPETLVFAAINDAPEYSVNEMDPALLDRFVTYDLVPTVADWITWARAEGLDELSIDFIKNHPEHLRPTKAVESGSITPTQRSWARMLKTLAEAGMSPTPLGGSDKDALPAGFYAICMGYIGTTTAIAFVNFIKNYDSIITAEDVVDRWKDVEKKVAKLPAERVLGLIEKVGNLCKDKELTLTQMTNLGSFAGVVSGEQVMALWNAVSSGKQANTMKFHKLIQGRILEVATRANSVKSK